MCGTLASIDLKLYIFPLRKDEKMLKWMNICGNINWLHLPDRFVCDRHRKLGLKLVSLHGVAVSTYVLILIVICIILHELFKLLIFLYFCRVDKFNDTEEIDPIIFFRFNDIEEVNLVTNFGNKIFNVSVTRLLTNKFDT